MSSIPEGVKLPEDRKTPAQREAEGGTATVTALGLTFEVPASIDDVSGEFLEAAESQASVRMIRAVLGAKQFRALKEKKPTVGDYKAIGDLVAELYGLEDAGN